VNNTVPPIDSAMRSRGKTFRAVTYDGAGHGFLRQLDGQEGANREAATQAWPETITWFRRYLENRG
jgi:dienelactone hydrolase